MSLRIHGLVERNNEPDIMPEPTERLWQGAGYVTQSARVGERRCLRRDKKNLHQQPLIICPWRPAVFPPTLLAPPH
jgi:hypothetical protein